MRAPVRLRLASSNAGKLAEYREMAGANGGSHEVELDLVPNFSSLPTFEESAQTFAENALGKALHYSRLCPGVVFADDSGLIVPALGGAPGVHSARYAGPGASDAQKVEKLLEELRAKTAADRKAYFVCAIAAAEDGRALAVVSDRVDGEILTAPRGSAGFGYDPLFLFPPLGKSFAELTRQEKSRESHRGRAFRKLLAWRDVLCSTAP